MPSQSRPPAPEPVEEEPTESFADLLRDFERSHSHKAEPGAKQLQGTVVSLSAEQVFLDIGYKTEGVLPRSAFENNGDGVKPGDTIPVSVTGRNEEHYYELSRFKVAQPRDWSALEAAFAEKLAVVGTVTEVIKGGLSVDIGVRAFMPASRSGAKDAVELEKLVGTQINCRITKLEVTDENVVVDRRVVLEEQARAESATRHAAMAVGDTLPGTVRTLMPYGAFIDLGGVDGLLHISDIAHSRVNKPEDVLTVGQELQVRILKIDPDTKKISLGLKQLQAEPWETAPHASSLASASPAPSPASWISALSSRSNPASKASSISRRWPGAKSSAIPATSSSRATVSMPSSSPLSQKNAASRSASSKPSPTPGSTCSATSLSARKSKAP